MVAIWAILLGALAPTVSHGVRAWTHSPTPWVEVCSSTNPDERGGRGLPSGEHAGEHCPFCLLHANDVALPSSPPPTVLPSQPARDALPALFLQAPRTLFAWAPSQARAPPASV